MAAEEDRMDDFIQKDFFKGFTYREICIFLERNHECVVSITTLKRKVKQLGFRRRMPCYNINAIRRNIAEMLDDPVIFQGEGGSSHNSTAACVLVN